MYCTGPIGQAMEGIAEILCNTSTWKTLMDTTSADDAALSIFIGELDLEGDAEPPRPHALITRGVAPLTLNSIATGANMTYTDLGSASIFIELTPSSGLTQQEEYIEALNNIESIVEEMSQLSGFNGNIHLNTLTLVEGPLKVELGKEANWGTFFAAQIDVEFGSNG